MVWSPNLHRIAPTKQVSKKSNLVCLLVMGRISQEQRNYLWLCIETSHNSYVEVFSTYLTDTMDVGQDVQILAIILNFISHTKVSKLSHVSYFQILRYSVRE